MTRRRRKVRRRTIKLDQRRRHELNVAARVQYVLLGYGSYEARRQVKRKEMRMYEKSLRQLDTRATRLGEAQLSRTYIEGSPPAGSDLSLT